MNQANTNEPENKKPRVWQPRETLMPDVKKYVQFKTNANLYNQIIDIVNSNRTSVSAIVRKLLYMGLREYELNRIAGRNKKDIEADYNKRLAEAQAIAAQKASRKNLKKPDTITAATPMLFRPDDEE